MYLLIFLGNFIANIATANSPRKSCQSASFTATDLAPQQSADNCAYTDAEWTVLCNRCCLLVHRCRGILLRRFDLANLGRSCMLNILMVHNGSMLDDFSGCHGRRRGL